MDNPKAHIPKEIKEMFDRVTVPLTLVDAKAEDTPLCLVNDSFCKLTGFSREELIGFNCRLLQGPDSEPASKASIRAMLEDKSEFETQVYITNYRKSRERFENYLYIFRLVDRKGETDFFLGSQFDMTSARQADDTSKHARELWNGIKMIKNPYAETAAMIIQSARLMSVSAANIARAKLAARST